MKPQENNFYENVQYQLFVKGFKMRLYINLNKTKNHKEFIVYDFIGYRWTCYNISIQFLFYYQGNKCTIKQIEGNFRMYE